MQSQITDLEAKHFPTMSFVACTLITVNALNAVNGGNSSPLVQAMKSGPFLSLKAPVSSVIIAFHTANLLLLSAS